MIHTKSRRLKS